MRGNYTKVLVLYPNGRTVNITDEFNYCLNNQDAPFFHIYENTIDMMGASELIFER